MKAAVLLFLVLLTVLTGDYVNNHTFVFISGWPQSGTSFLHQLLDTHDKFSSMITLCEKKIGVKPCTSFNHEGQWVLSNTLKDKLKSGKICRIDHFDNDTSAGILQEWSNFWTMDKPYLVEKSPQSFLKINALQKVFSASNVKFLIILKHPVTLNVATPRERGWRFPIEHKLSVGSPEKNFAKREISADEMTENARFFFDFMLRDDNSSLGWIPAMRELHNILTTNPSSLDLVRIVRYEQMARPLPMCLKILSFLLGPSTMQKEFCVKMFGDSVMASTKMISPLENRVRTPPRRPNVQQKISRSLQLIINENINSSVNRVLRMRGSTTGFYFHSELVTQRGLDRINDFVYSYQRLPEKMRKQFDEIDNQLSSFGYRLQHFSMSDSFVFKEWEIR